MSKKKVSNVTALLESLTVLLEYLDLLQCADALWLRWFGGFWERLIGLTKNAIKKVLGRAFVSLSTLQTIVRFTSITNHYYFYYYYV